MGVTNPIKVKLAEGLPVALSEFQEGDTLSVDRLPVVTDVGETGSDSYVPTEQAVRSAISAITGIIPSTHASTHQTEGADPIAPADIGASASNHDHSGVYDPAGTGTDAVQTHVGLLDPHSQYLTQTEADARYVQEVTADLPFYTTDGQQHNIPLIGGGASSPTYPSMGINDGDATPSMGTLMQDAVFYTQNTSVTTITALHNGDDGCRRTILILDNNTVFQTGASMRLNLSENFTASTNDSISFIKCGSIWYETSRTLT